MANPLLQMDQIKKHYGAIVALDGVSFNLMAGEVHCLLGDNGAGKTSFIKTMSGAHKPTSGEIHLNGEKVVFENTRQAIDKGIATVYQDLALVPLMSIARNFVMGREPIKKSFGFLPTFDKETAARVASEQISSMGINIRDSNQAVGTLSGGERQIVAIARAVYYGAKILILDEPTSALGVYQTENVLATIDRVRDSGIGVVFITHNAQHALAIGDRFTVLNRGSTLATVTRSKTSFTDLQQMMAGGRELKPANKKYH